MALTQIKTGAIADNAITEDKILNDAVTSSKIPANAVGTSEIADDAVTGDKVPNNLDISDNNKIRFGTGNDLAIYHDGTNSIIKNETGGLLIQTDGDVKIEAKDGGKDIIHGIPTGACQIHYDGSLKIQTESYGASLTGFLKTSAPVAWYGRQGTTENSIATDTWTTVTNLTIHPVTTTGWDGSTGIFTVPTGQGGTYFLTGGVGIDDVQSRDFVYIGFSKNDATPSPYQWGKQSYDSSNALVNVNMTILMALADGDTVRMKTKHNEGTTENTEYAVTFFGGYRIT